MLNKSLQYIRVKWFLVKMQSCLDHASSLAILRVSTLDLKLRGVKCGRYGMMSEC